MGRIVHIVAYDNKGVIGLKDKLPFNIPEDLKQFKDLTADSLICMGYNTFQSIVDNHMQNKTKFLEGRKVAVVCSVAIKANQRNKQYNPIYDNVNFFDKDTFQHLVTRNNAPIIIVGGKQLYKMFSPSLIIATEVDIDSVAANPTIEEADIVKYPSLTLPFDPQAPQNVRIKRLPMEEKVSATGTKYRTVVYTL